MKTFNDDDQSIEEINPLGEDKFTVEDGEFTVTSMTEVEARQAVIDDKQAMRDRRKAREEKQNT